MNKYWKNYESLHTTIRIGILKGEPQVFDCWTSSQCSRPGIAIETLREICALLAIECHFIGRNDSAYGDNISGIWRGMVREIMDGKYHTSIGNFNPTAERVKVIDFSVPIFDEHSLLVTRFPSPTKFSPGAIFGFQWSSILAILACILLIGVLGVAFEFSHHSSRQQPKWIEKHYGSKSDLALGSIKRSLDAASVLFQQGMTEVHTSLAFYVLAAIWGLCCIVLIGIYSSFILVAALGDKRDLPFWDAESVGACIFEGECQMITNTLSLSYYDRIYNAETGQMLQLRNAFRRIPPRIVSKENISDALQDNAGYNVGIMGSMAFSKLLQNNSPCTLDSVFLNAEYVAFPFNKKDRALRNMFNKAIEILQENGVLKRIYNRYIGSFLDGSKICKQKSPSSEPMGIEAFVGAYFAIAGGAFLGFLVLACENGVQCLPRYEERNGCPGMMLTSSSDTSTSSSPNSVEEFIGSQSEKFSKSIPSKRSQYSKNSTN